MATIETVSGPVDEEQLGLTLSHEHIRSTSEGARATFPHLSETAPSCEPTSGARPMARRCRPS